MERETYTVDEVAELLGISRGLAYHAARTGELGAIRVGKRLLVPRETLRQLLRQQGAAEPEE